MSEKEDLLSEAREAFSLCEDAEKHNRATALESIEFARAGRQWPEHIEKDREQEGRPCLTINRMPAFIRQVVNDARQNKPAIKVHPADSGADPQTAEIINGLIRNIEYTSNAEVAYDTATEAAVSGGFGYIRVGLDYAFDDAFDLDITINRVSNPFSVYGDPNSQAADSSDWDVAFVVDRLSKKQYERDYKGAQKVNWYDDSWLACGDAWFSDDSVMVAEWWTREQVDRKIVLLDDGRVLDAEALTTDPDLRMALEAGLFSVAQERTTKSHKVTQRILSGAEVLETRDWPGRYIPIIPVYGDEFDIEGKRYFRSLIYNAMDAQRMVNYWRTTATELVALAPKVPWIGPKGAFNTDAAKWATANNRSHSYLQYDGPVPPTRIPLDSGPAAGALQEALNATDDMKAIMGLFDASLGARSNETSGRAIMARQREGDVSTFHFVDNMARAIRHTGRVVIDLIPKVYDKQRIVRVLGEDGKAEAKQINAPYPVMDPQTGQPAVDEQGQAIMAMHDLTAGKYDLTVTTGPSFTTRREEAAMQMTEMIRAFPAAAPVVGPELAKNLDWPGADKIAEKLEAMTSGQVPPQVQQQIEQGQQQIQQLTEENQQLKLNQQADMAKLEAQKQIDAAKLQSQEEMKRLEIESEERIAIMKIQSQQEIDAMKARYMAENQADANRARVAQASQQGTQQ